MTRMTPLVCTLAIFARVGENFTCVSLLGVTVELEMIT